MREDKIVNPIKLSQSKKVIRERLPNLKLQSLKYLGGGSTSAFVINNELVIKFPKIGFEGQLYRDFEKRYQKEVKLNALLSKTVKPHEIVIPLQRLEVSSKSFKGPIFLYRYFEGAEVDKSKFNNNQKNKLAELLGDFLSKLHSVPLSKVAILGLSRITSKDIKQGWNKQYQYYKRSVFPLLHERELQWFTKLYKDFLDKSDNMKPKVVLTHGDFGPENVLVPKQFNRLQIIDFEDIGLGDAVGDFCVWYQHYGIEFIDRMLDSYSSVDKHFLTRIRFYSSRLPLIYFNLYRKSGNKGFLLFARKSLKKILKMEANN